MIEVFSPAKINFVLEILNKRNDGFHEISSVMSAVTLKDTIQIAESNHNTVKFISRYNNDFDEAIAETHKIIESMNTIGSTSFPVNIIINKNILSPSGLGGISSNFASIISAINELWCLNLSKDQLKSFSLKFGSDISFFFDKKPGLVSGRGELIKLLPEKILCPIIIMPMSNIEPQPHKTKTMYSKIIQDDMTDGNQTQAFVNNIVNTDNLNDYCFNVFNAVIKRHYPKQYDAMKHIENIIDMQVHLSGSGPAIYTIPNHLNTVKNIKTKLINNNIEFFVVDCLQDA